MQISIETNSHSYDVYVGRNILKAAFESEEKLLQQADQIIVLTDKNVWEAQGTVFERYVAVPFKTYIMPAGENCKSFENYEAVQTFLLQQHCTRKSLIIAFGGGAVGDLAGFVAATFMRGIPFIQVPTTILAHDSAVGGKTAINHPLGKNMIGAFYQPLAVIYDTTLLETLPKREVLSGMAEIIKHALISDEKWLEELMQSDLLDLNASLLTHYLALGIQVKAQIVEQDETEQSVRKYLNLGHTYGHAVEAAAGYGQLAHGEAVMIGLVYALLLSERFGHIKRNLTERFLQFAMTNDYPLTAIAKYPFEELQTYLVKDKKAVYGKLQFVLLNDVGQPFMQQVDMAECIEVDCELRKLIAEVGV